MAMAGDAGATHHQGRAACLRMMQEQACPPLLPGSRWHLPVLACWPLVVVLMVRTGQQALEEQLRSTWMDSSSTLAHTMWFIGMTLSFFLNVYSRTLLPSIDWTILHPTSLPLSALTVLSAVTPVAMFCRDASRTKGLRFWRYPSTLLMSFVISLSSSWGDVFVLLTGPVVQLSEFLHGTIDMRACWHGEQPLCTLGLGHSTTSCQTSSRLHGSHQRLLYHQV